VPPNSSAKKRGGIHALLNLTVLAIFIFVAAHRGSPDVKPDGLAILGSLIGVAILSYSGWLGGTLVYRNQIGVDHRYANAGTWRQRTLDSFDRPVCNTSELAPGQMMLAIVKGERIAVGRCETGIAAFSDHCTHRGGPLSDGALVSCTVQCPWHGSNFDVYTGRVVAGPAEQRIETYQIDVRNNEVYVIPKREETKKAA
jgi:nitrite reductase/ring-hydroxylating ferredoxin subunit